MESWAYRMGESMMPQVNLMLELLQEAGNSIQKGGTEDGN